MSYQIDIKVYATTPAHEVPFILPAKMLRDKMGDMFQRHVSLHQPVVTVITPGYYTYIVDYDEKAIDELYEWMNNQSDIKLLGVTKI